MSKHGIWKVRAEGYAHDVLWDYRWVCECGRKSVWFSDITRRDASAERHLAKYEGE
jgi:hypothetical protein